MELMPPLHFYPWIRKNPAFWFNGLKRTWISQLSQASPNFSVSISIILLISFPLDTCRNPHLSSYILTLSSSVWGVCVKLSLILSPCVLIYNFNRFFCIFMTIIPIFRERVSLEVFVCLLICRECIE